MRGTGSDDKESQTRQFEVIFYTVFEKAVRTLPEYVLQHL
jgi:hypothetical protein